MIVMKSILVRASVLALGIALLFLAGCTAIKTKTSRFYVLSSMAGVETEKQVRPSDTSNISISIGPISLPKYLRKPQIVTRTGNNELNLAEFDRWAGKIEEDIGRVIAENLGHMLATDKVLSYPSMQAIGPDYNIQIDISRFDGRLGGDIELIVRWAVLDGQGRAVHGIKATHIIESAGGEGYADMVLAQSKALAVFSRELADVIKELTEG
jgi:uncharacterized lipoprotein YmbA